MKIGYIALTLGLLASLPAVSADTCDRRPEVVDRAVSLKDNAVVRLVAGVAVLAAGGVLGYNIDYHTHVVPYFRPANTDSIWKDAVLKPLFKNVLPETVALGTLLWVGGKNVYAGVKGIVGKLTAPAATPAK